MRKVFLRNAAQVGRHIYAAQKIGLLHRGVTFGHSHILQNNTDMPGLLTAIHNKTRHGTQRVRTGSKRRQMRTGTLNQVFSFLARPFKA